MISKLWYLKNQRHVENGKIQMVVESYFILVSTLLCLTQ